MALNTFSALCPNTAPIEKSLASHMISNSLFQFGFAMMGASTSLDLISSKEFWQDSSKLNLVSFSSNLHSGLQIFEKSLINLL